MTSATIPPLSVSFRQSWRLSYRHSATPLIGGGGWRKPIGLQQPGNPAKLLNRRSQEIDEPGGRLAGVTDSHHLGTQGKPFQRRRKHGGRVLVKPIFLCAYSRATPQNATREKGRGGETGFWSIFCDECPDLTTV